MGSSIKYAITGLKISNLFEINNLLESIGICHDWKELRKQILLRTPVDYISYADEENTIGVCKYCAEEWKIDSVLKQKKAKTAIKRIVINGGQSVGKSLRAVFADAIQSPNLTKEIISFWTDERFYDEDSYSRVYLHFSSYPFLIDVTDIS